MPANQERLWHELGIIAAIYLGSVVVYTIVMGNFYGENTGADIPELLKQIPKFLRPRMGARDKVDLVILAISVVIYTLPLAISSALIGYATRARSLSFILVIVCIVGPFVFYYWIFDSDVLRDQIHELPYNSQGWTKVTFSILLYYVQTFKIATVGSVLFGGWAGYRLAE
jgi:hypothetical protein